MQRRAPASNSDEHLQRERQALEAIMHDMAGAALSEADSTSTYQLSAQVGGGDWLEGRPDSFQSS